MLFSRGVDGTATLTTTYFPGCGYLSPSIKLCDGTFPDQHVCRREAYFAHGFLILFILLKISLFVIRVMDSTEVLIFVFGEEVHGT